MACGRLCVLSYDRPFSPPRASFAVRKFGGIHPAGLLFSLSIPTQRKENAVLQLRDFPRPPRGDRPVSMHARPGNVGVAALSAGALCSVSSFQPCNSRAGRPVLTWCVQRGLGAIRGLFAKCNMIPIMCACKTIGCLLDITTLHSCPPPPASKVDSHPAGVSLCPYLGTQGREGTISRRIRVALPTVGETRCRCLMFQYQSEHDRHTLGHRSLAPCTFGDTCLRSCASHPQLVASSFSLRHLA